MRVNPNPDLRFLVSYKSARTCCVCRIPRKAVQIHHIDQNNANTVEENLALLCHDCHDEAHTKHSLSQNLTPNDIVRYKAEWEATVKTMQETAMRPDAQPDGISMASWAYLNHDRILELARHFKIDLETELFRKLRESGATDADGIIQPLLNAPDGRDVWTVYDQLPHHFRFPVKRFYTNIIDDIVTTVSPIEIDSIWRRRDINALISPGRIFFSNRGIHFKRQRNLPGSNNYTIKCLGFKGGIQLRFEVSTRDMFGSSSYSDSFTGHRTAAVLLLLKSFSNEAGNLVLHCTPIAMGVSFAKFSIPATSS